MASLGKVAAGAGTGAAVGSAFGPWGTAIGAVGGGLLSLLGGSDDNAAPAPPTTQYGGNPLTDQLAAQQYAAGLQQQQAQNAREAAFYNQANGNLDIANAAQLRQGPQIATNSADQARQLAALKQASGSVGNLNDTGAQLTALGTRPMGPSYAEAQLRQGQDAAMAQQLAMARSGRSLGSGQDAMARAAYNNMALNQQTNLAAANARIQEQNAYNQFQVGALGAAGQQYGAAGALAGQVGNQATQIRSGNEGVQAQNANLQLQQQGVNNQTTGLYNQLAAQQQAQGMAANQMGQQAQQFGSQQASGMLGAQANADTGRLSSTTATNIANQNNANAHDAANMNMAATGLGAAANTIASATQADSTPSNPNNPSGSTSAYSNITKSSNNPNGDRLSDENQKKNVAPVPLTSPATDAKDRAKYAGFSPEAAAVYRAADQAAARGDDTYTVNGKTMPLHPYGDAPMDPDTNKIAVTGEGGPRAPSYAETIGALNNGYRASQFAPTDVLNRVPGAGAGNSASQNAVIAQMMAKPGSTMHTATPPVNREAAQQSVQNLQRVPLTQAPSSFQLNLGNGPAPAAAAPGLRTLPGNLAEGRITPPTPAAQPAWGDVFNAPRLDPRIQAYLNGASPYPVSAPAPTPTHQVAQLTGVDDETFDASRPKWVDPDVSGNSAGPIASDARGKTRIRELEAQVQALGGAPSARPQMQQPDTAALDEAYAREGGQPRASGWRDRDQFAGPESYPHRWDADPFAPAPAVDLRAAPAYSYEYKNPSAPGAAPGRHIGPMAQDLERTAAAGTVRDTPHGKMIDTQGLTMVNTAALSEQQRKTQELEQQLAAIQAAQYPSYNQGLYPTVH